MLTLTKLSDGNLEITATEEERAEIREMIAADYGYFRITADLLEDHLGNGWEWLNPEEIGALTDDANVILSDDVLRGDKDNEVLYVGNCWYDNFYAIRDWYRKLADEGKVVFYDAGPTEYTDDETTTFLKNMANLLLYAATGGSPNYPLQQGFDSIENDLMMQKDALGRQLSVGHEDYASNLRKLAMLRQMRARVLGQDA